MNKLFKVIKKNCLNHKWFVFLLFLALIIRILYIKDNVFPFVFDHGKDSLAILEMVSVPKLKLIGPWTSIPGLYFGPGWYYFLAPFALIGKFNPIFFVFAMILLVLTQMYLSYKYFNIESSAIIGFSGFWIMISRSAWNPYPMTLLSMIILILLFKQIRLKNISNKLLMSLFFTASLGFHFSSAFAIFYPIIIVLILLLYKFKFTIKNLFISSIGFIIPFLPQILFELKNNFPQSKAIIEYFSNGETNPFGLEKIKNVILVTLGEFRIILFESSPRLSVIAWYLSLFFILVSFYFIIKKKVLDKEIKNLFIISFIFILIPTVGFLFLHFNVWYVYPMIPIVTILLGSLINRLPKIFGRTFILLYVLFSFLRLNYYLRVEKPVFLYDRIEYSVKEKIIDYIRRDAGSRSFSVYTYMPDIYDFPYQYIFLVQGLEGKDLPVEFSYEPKTPLYIREKKNILKVIDSKYGRRWSGSPKVIYYIVTDNSESELLTNWWGRQRFEKITSEKKFGDKIVVYSASVIRNNN